MSIISIKILDITTRILLDLIKKLEFQSEIQPDIFLSANF